MRSSRFLGKSLWSACYVCWGPQYQWSCRAYSQQLIDVSCSFPEPGPSSKWRASIQKQLVIYGLRALDRACLVPDLCELSEKKRLFPAAGHHLPLTLAPLFQSEKFYCRFALSQILPSPCCHHYKHSKTKRPFRAMCDPRHGVMIYL